MADVKKQKDKPDNLNGYGLHRRPGLVYAKYLEDDEVSVFEDGEFTIWPVDLFEQEFNPVTPATASLDERVAAAEGAPA